MMLTGRNHGVSGIMEYQNCWWLFMSQRHGIFRRVSNTGLGTGEKVYSCTSRDTYLDTQSIFQLTYLVLCYKNKELKINLMI